MGFIPDIERICKLVPFTRQTLFFTATMPPDIRRITEAFLHNPAKVEVSKPATAAVTVAQSQVPAGREASEKRDVLRRLLRDAKDLKNAIIFCNRKREVAILHKSLQKHGFAVAALHGDMDQPARMAALDQFRKGELPLLVASDVAARGLDIPEVSHIFNFDVPHHPDDYVHRIGRTGRAGRSGTAISIVTPLDQKSVAAIEKLIGQSIPRAEGDFAPPETSHTDQPREHKSKDSPRRGRKGNREREPRHANGRQHGAKPPSAAQRPPREAEEPADHSHLPAFLLRPVRARA
jgi:superfamily II DNA/RNA helicase